MFTCLFHWIFPTFPAKALPSQPGFPTLLILPRSFAEPGRPVVYQEMCFRISRMPRIIALTFHLHPRVTEHHSLDFFFRRLIQDLPVLQIFHHPRKSQGLPLAARPIMTPSQPVESSKAFAFSGLIHVPISITGSIRPPSPAG